MENSEGNSENIDLKRLLDEIKNVKAIVTQTNEDLNVIKNRLSKLENDNEQLKEKIITVNEVGANLEDRIKEMERYSRKDNLILSGIPSTREEDVKEIVKAVAKDLGMVLHDFDVCAAHRLPNKKGTPYIIIKMLCNETKIELIKRAKRKQLKMQGLPVYLSDHLLPVIKVPLSKAKQLRREGFIKFGWTRNGDLFVKKNEGDGAKKIKASNDLNEFRGTDQKGEAPSLISPRHQPTGSAARETWKCTGP